MKRYIILYATAAVAVMALLPVSAQEMKASMNKQVEVTKLYVPDIAPADKLAIEPDMTDTVKMRPDIDYSITPLSWQTNLTTEKFRPATMSYWDFNRPRNFYLKAGVGYPLLSEGDLYASTQNPDTGFLTFYANHNGRYDNIKNFFGEKYDSRSMHNRLGLNLGWYAGKRILEGDFSYDMNDCRRYAGSKRVGEDADQRAKNLAAAVGDKVSTGVLNGAIRFGDDFEDLSRVNFNIGVRGSMFRDKSAIRNMNTFETPVQMGAEDMRYAENTLGASAAIARGFGRHSLRADVDFDTYDGVFSLRDYGNTMLRAGLRYGRDGGKVDYMIGADYHYDKYRFDDKPSHYVTPYLRLRFNISRKGHFVPFIEADGEMRNNGYMSLTRINPYVIPGTTADNTLQYNARVGFSGNVAGDRLAYRILLGASFAEKDLFWYVQDYMWFGVENARRNTLYFKAELTYRPVSGFILTAGAEGRSFSKKSGLNNAVPAFEGHAGAEYNYRGWKFGVRADMCGVSYWTNKIGSDTANWRTFKKSFTTDMTAYIEWSYRSDVGFYLEGRNLLNESLYPIAYYRNYGIGGVFGVKVQF